MLILIVDDTELLYVLPLSDNSMNAINSKNNAMVKNMKLVFSAMSAYLVSRRIYPRYRQKRYDLKTFFMLLSSV